MSHFIYVRNLSLCVSNSAISMLEYVTLCKLNIRENLYHFIYVKKEYTFMWLHSAILTTYNFHFINFRVKYTRLYAFFL